jgi:tetratricopeptide (TPR) repeat protein
MSASAFVLAVTLLAPQQSAPAPGPDVVGQAYFLFLQGRTLDANGDTSGAIAAYQRALELLPRAADIHAEMAGVYARNGRANEAMASAESALSIDPANREAHRILGLVQAALSDMASANASAAALRGSAVKHLEVVAADGPDDPGVQLALGRLYMRGEQYDKAFEILRAFLQGQPGYAEALSLFGEAAEATDHWQDAADAWGQLVEQGDRGQVFRVRYATALVNAGDVSGGRRELLQAATESPRDVSVWYLLSQVQRRVGDAAGAEAAAKKIAEIDPNDGRGPLATAEARIAAADLRGAADVLRPRVAAARADDIESGVYARMASALGAVLLDLGDKDGAVSVLEGAQQRLADDLDLKLDLANAYERAGRIEDAERVLREVVTTSPRHAPALNFLGYMLAEHSRKLDDAVGFVERALAIDPGNPSYLDSLGWAYFRQSKFEAALSPLERAAAGDPNGSVIQDHLGDLYMQLKRYKDALAAFDRALAGDRQNLDAAAVTKKRDRARELAGR